MDTDNDNRNRFVGKGKTHLPSRESKDAQRERSQEELLAHLKEFEEWANPSFNVLVVQMPRPNFLQNDTLKFVRETFHDTGELLQSILRFGLPQTSVRNKLPYWREDNSPLKTSPSVRLRIAIAAMQVPTSTRAPGVDAIESGRDAAAAAGGIPASSSTLGGTHAHMHLHGDSHHHAHRDPHTKRNRFLFDGDPVNPGMIVGINAALWWFLSTPINSRRRML